MSKYPVEIPFKFSQEIDIKEDQIPFAKVSILTDNLPDETIDFFPSQTTPTYTPTWYCFGDDTLLYAGDTIVQRLAWGLTEANRFSAKWIRPTPFFNRYHVYWDENSITAVPSREIYPMQWFLWEDGKYRPILPGSPGSSSPKLIMPYANITIKRNSGITAEEANGINTSFDVPTGYTYPNLLKKPTMRFPSVQNTTSKIWLKTGINKYRLIVYGRFCKWTDKRIISGGDYINGTYNYIPFYNETSPGLWQSYYKLDSYTEVARNQVLYGASLNPSNIRLLVNYVNTSGQNEVRKYEIQT